MKRKIKFQLLILLLFMNHVTGQELFNRYKLDAPVADTTQIMNLIRNCIAIERRCLDTTHIDSTMALYYKGLQQSLKINFSDGITMSLLGIGECYFLKNDYRRAQLFLKKSLVIANQVKDKRLPAHIYLDMQVINFHQGEYALSVYYGYQFLNYISENPSLDYGPLVSSMYSNLGAVWVILQDTTMAITFLEKAELIAKKEKDSLTLGSIYSNLGALNYSIDPLKSYQYSLNALQYPSLSGKITAYHNLAEYMSSIKNDDSMIYYSKQALQLAIATKKYEQEMKAYGQLGGAYYQIKDYKNAKSNLLIALTQMQKGDVKDNVIDIYSMLASVYAVTGKYKDAWELQKKYINAYKETMNKDAWELLRREEIKYKTNEKDKEILQQKNNVKEKNIWIISISAIGLLLIGLLGSLYRSNHHKQQLQTKQIHILQQEQKIGQLKAIMDGEEKERIRIARELHDGIGGMIAATKMAFSMLKKECEPILSATNSAPKIDSFNKIMGMLDETSTEIRETAHNLFPNVLTQYGLFEALKLYIDKINTSDVLYIRIEANDDLKVLDESFQLTIYRIIQELIQNIIKHSGATNALIQITQVENILHIFVRDNGRGINNADNTGSGLHNIQLRVKALHGDISLEATAGTGMAVNIKFDLQNLINPLYEYSRINS